MLFFVGYGCSARHRGDDEMSGLLLYEVRAILLSVQLGHERTRRHRQQALPAVCVVLTRFMNSAWRTPHLLAMAVKTCRRVAWGSCMEHTIG